MAQMAGRAIRARFSAMVMPGAVADQRKYKQKRGQYGADLECSNCAVVLHSERCFAGSTFRTNTAARITRTFSVLQTRWRRIWLQRKR